MQNDLDPIQLILHASITVQLVMLTLILASVFSWWIIYDRAVLLRKARVLADAFEDRFWSGIDLAELYRDETAEGREPAGMAAVFALGFREFVRLKRNPGFDTMAVIEGARRQMNVALSREMERLEAHLATLATVGSTSPYVGLFGTVWGIMSAFHALGNMKQATLSLVAPGIAEALIATAMGLFAAIPAVVAYNRYSNTVERLNNRYEDFLDEFTSILQRQSHQPLLSLQARDGTTHDTRGFLQARRPRRRQREGTEPPAVQRPEPERAARAMHLRHLRHADHARRQAAPDPRHRPEPHGLRFREAAGDLSCLLRSGHGRAEAERRAARLRGPPARLRLAGRFLRRFPAATVRRRPWFRVDQGPARTKV